MMVGALSFRLSCDVADVFFFLFFSIALSWFKDHFIKCNDRAALVKTWLPAQYDGPKSWLDQLVYDRALVLVRSALWFHWLL